MKKNNKKSEENFLDIIPIKVHLNYKKQDGNIHLVFTHNSFIQRFLRWMINKNTLSCIDS